MSDQDSLAARQLFDREVSPDILSEWTAQTAAPKPAREGARQGVLLVRAAGEWLGLPTAIVDAALPMGPVHSVPYLSSPVFIGLANVDGELLPCIRLSALLGALPAQSGPDEDGEAGGQAQHKTHPRLIALTLPEGRFALAVDEAAGTGGYDPEAASPAPDTVSRAPSPLVLRMAVVEGRLAGIADAASLGRALLRSLRP
ncbi:MAG: chemotaxis protein CheW [Acidobacteriota bacterium]